MVFNSIGRAQTRTAAALVILILSGVATAATIPNPSFEIPGLAPSAYEYNPAGASWTFAGSSGIAAQGPASPWLSSPNPPPDGNQVAFLQVSMPGVNPASQDYFFEDITGLNAGDDYEVSFFAAQRAGTGSTYAVNDFSVLVCAAGSPCLVTPTVIESDVIPGSTAFTAFTTSAFSATAASVTLQFQSLDSITPDAPDADALIDFVQITDLGSIPEPSCVVLLGSGMIGLFWLSRRKLR